MKIEEWKKKHKKDSLAVALYGKPYSELGAAGKKYIKNVFKV